MDGGRERVVVERDGAALRTADGDFLAQLEDPSATVRGIDDTKAQRHRLVGGGGSGGWRLSRLFGPRTPHLDPDHACRVHEEEPDRGEQEVAENL